MWLLQRIQLRLKCCRMYLAPTSVTINTQPATPAAPTAALQLCKTNAVATGTITVTAPTGKESRIALMVRLIPTLLEYLLMWLLQLIQLRKNAAGCISAPTSNY
jgi:hypothetical protein